MNKPGDTNPGYGVCETWTEVLDSEGATQMKYLKKLLYRIYSQEELSRVETVVLCRKIAASNVYPKNS